MKKRLLVLLIFGLFSGLLLAAKQGYIKLQTIEGKTIHIKGTENGLEIPEYKDKVVFVEFWGTHRPPCMASIPHYVDMIKNTMANLLCLESKYKAPPKYASRPLRITKKSITMSLHTKTQAILLITSPSEQAGRAPFHFC